MSAASSHPELLLFALDEALDHEIRLIIYGRSAIWLGFDNPPAAAAITTGCGRNYSERASPGICG